MYANCSVCNLTKVIEASSASFFGAGVTSGAIAIGGEFSKGGVKYETGVVIFPDDFEAAARVDGDGFGVVSVTGAPFVAGVVFATGALFAAGVVFATGAVLVLVSGAPFGAVFLGFGVGLTSAPPAATFASD